MPLIKPRTHRVQTVRHLCRLRAPNRDTLFLYARFIGDTVDYVVNQLIETTLAKDRDFLAWRAAQAGLPPVASEPAQARSASPTRPSALRGDRG